MTTKDKYIIDLFRLPNGVSEFTFILDDTFFQSIENSEIVRGNVSVDVVVDKKTYAYEFKINLLGEVYLLCDRCLEEMSYDVSLDEELIVRMGEEYSEPEDKLVVIPDTIGKIDLSWYLYEYVALSLPMQHSHNEGECDESMLSKLEEHLAISITEEELEENIEEDVDPRWNELKKIINNN